VAVSAVPGIVLAVPVALATSWDPFALLRWDFASLVFDAWVWRTVWPLDAEQRAAGRARGSDPHIGRRARELAGSGAIVAPPPHARLVDQPQSRGRGTAIELRGSSPGSSLAASGPSTRRHRASSPRADRDSAP
jgi:hypothetical protein